MTIFINGQERTEKFTTLGEAVAAVSSAPSGIAAALNDKVIPRSQWDSTELLPGARIEIVTAVQGG